MVRFVLSTILAGVLCVTPACGTLKGAVTNPVTTIEIDLEQARQEYAKVRYVVAYLIRGISASCQAGQIPEDKCLQFQTFVDQAVALDKQIQVTLYTPGVKPDYAAIAEILKVAVKLILL